MSGAGREAGRLALVQGRYTALLTSLHGTGLYERFHDWTRDTPEEAQAARDYLAGGIRLSGVIARHLRNDPVYAPYATEEAVARNRRLVALWDRLSLALCHGVRAPITIPDVPTADGDPSRSRSTPVDGDPLNVTVDPWPFRTAPSGSSARAVACRRPSPTKPPCAPPSPPPPGSPSSPIYGRIEPQRHREHRDGKREDIDESHFFSALSVSSVPLWFNRSG